MTYEELVGKVRALYEKTDASGIKEHIAYQFNIEGEASGAFYLEISEGAVKVEPYEYYDRDVLFTTTAAILLGIGSGEIDAVSAVLEGKLRIEGNQEKALVLKEISGKSGETEKSAAEPLTEAVPEGKEEETEPKAEEKPEVKEGKTEPKAEEKPEGKTEKAEQKTEDKKEVTEEKPEAKQGPKGEQKAAQTQDPKKWPNRKKKKR